MSKYPLGDWLTSVNFSKEDLRDREDGEVWMKKYPAYIVNRCLSGHIDAVLLVNELNRWHGLDNDLQYSFYLNSLRKKRRFSPGKRRNKSKTLTSSKNTSSIQMKKHGMRCEF